MARHLFPWGLPQEHTTQVIPVSVTLQSAQAPAQSGIVTALLPIAGVYSNLGPWLLPTPIRNINPIVGNVSVTLVGAGVSARGEELEGSDAVLYLDGGEVVAGAGVVTFNFSEGVEKAVARVFVSGASKSVVFSGTTKKIRVE